MHAGRIGIDVLAITEETAEKSQSHRAAADIAGTDKKNVFHDDPRRDNEGLRQSKIKRPQVNEPRPQTVPEMTGCRSALTTKTP